MADEYVPIEFPKYLAKYGCVVENAEQEAAVTSGEAKVVETESAQGSTFAVEMPTKPTKKKGR